MMIFNESELASVVRNAVRDGMREAPARPVNENDTADGFLSVKAAAHYLSCSVTWIRKQIREHKLNAGHNGRHYRIRKADLNAFLETNFRPPEGTIDNSGIAAEMVLARGRAKRKG